MKVQGQVCIVFGGARNIGKEYVSYLLKEGAKVGENIRILSVVCCTI